MIRVVARNTIKIDKLQEFLKLAKELGLETNKEDGCVEYILAKDLKIENTFTFIEKWETMKHLEAHFEAPHFKRIVPQFGGLVETAHGIDIYEEV